MRKIYCILLVCLFAVLMVGCKNENSQSFISKSSQASKSSGEETTGDVADNKEEASAYVYVCGEVNKPGVYGIRARGRVHEAIELAGGLTEAADSSAINMAAVVKDQEQIIVPAIGDGNASVNAETKNGLVNINKAGKETLMTLPGIGESKANSIIAYRESKGSFKDIADLQNIEGIKSGVYNKIKNSITV